MKKKNWKLLKYLATKVNLILLLTLIVLLYLVTVIDNGTINTIIYSENLKVYKIATIKNNSKYEFLCNVGIAIVTGFIVSYNYSRYNEFKEKKIILLGLEEHLNNFIRFHLNLLFSSNMLNRKLKNRNPGDRNLTSNVLISKNIENAYILLKKLASGEHSAIFFGGNAQYPLRLNYMDYLYKLQKKYYLESYGELLIKTDYLREKAYLFTSQEKKALNNISTLIFQMGNIKKDIEEYEKYEYTKNIIKGISIGGFIEGTPLSYRTLESNASIIINYFYEIEKKINYLEEPLKLCREYLGTNTYFYRYDYESILISKEEFQDSLGEDILNPLIKKYKINISPSLLKKTMNSEIINITEEKLEFSGEQKW